MAKKSTLAERLQKIMQAEGWTPSQLARAAGTTRQHIWNYMKDGVQPRDTDFAFRLQDKYLWNARWILNGTGPQKISAVSPENQRIIKALEDSPPERRRAVATLLGIE